MKKCPYCAEQIEDAAIVCRSCHQWLIGDETGPAGQSSGPPPAASSLGVVDDARVAAERAIVDQQTTEQRRAQRRRRALLARRTGSIVLVFGLALIILVSIQDQLADHSAADAAETLRHPQIYNSLLTGDSTRSAPAIFHTADDKIEAIRAEERASGWALENLSPACTPATAGSPSWTASSPSASQGVIYEVVGDTSAHYASLTYELPLGVTQQEAEVELRWSKEVPIQKLGLLPYMSAQNRNSAGCVTVRIKNAAMVLKEDRSCGKYVIASVGGKY